MIKSISFDINLNGNNEILPCPFCGSTELTINNTHNSSTWISCDKCEVQVNGENYGGTTSMKHLMLSIVSTLDKWNNRDGGFNLEKEQIKDTGKDTS